MAGSLVRQSNKAGPLSTQCIPLENASRRAPVLLLLLLLLLLLRLRHRKAWKQRTREKRRWVNEWGRERGGGAGATVVPVEEEEKEEENGRSHAE